MDNNKIKAERLKLGISQSELAKQLKVSKQSICDWEKNRHIPKSKYLIQLSKIFNTTIDYLLEQEGEENNL